jgi:hypothetical protein
MKLVVIVWLSAGAFVAAGCADGRGVPTSPGATAAVAAAASAATASPRSGTLHVTKECSRFESESICTIKSSNLKAIEVDSTILYLQPEKVFSADGSAVILDLPGPGNNKAFGHCSLATGKCSFLGGTGKFTWFHADVDVTHDENFAFWFWEGTYSFNPHD